jgi:hypothetical protein
LSDLSNGNSTTTEPVTDSTKTEEESKNDEWQVLYDKDSEDDEINLSQTSGLKGSFGEVKNLPDLAPYNLLKIQFSAASSAQYYVFDISSKELNKLRILHNNATMSQIYGCDLTVNYNSDGKFALTIGNVVLLALYSNKYPSMTSMKNDSSICYWKILAK